MTTLNPGATRPAKRAATALIAAVWCGLGGTGGTALGGTLVAENFTGANVTATAAATGGATAEARVEAAGTIDAYLGEPGRCAVLAARFPAAGGKGAATLTIDLASAGASAGSANTSSADLGLLTLAADVRADRAGPVGVRVMSLDAAGRATGSLGGTVYPPAIGSWYRHGMDLSTLKPAGGTFDPTAAKVRVCFDLPATAGGAAAGSADASATLHVDNVSLSGPSFFVSEAGSDKADGRTEATAFKTVQRGIEAAGPGDTVVVLPGTYRNTSGAGIANINKAGSPAKWITVRGVPGRMPKLINNGWEVFKLMPGAAYIELRGMEMIGNAKNVKLADALADGKIKEKDGKKYGGDPIFNGNAVSAEGRSSEDLSKRPHHLRYIGNYVHDHCGAGLCANFSDYITSEGNTVEHNVHYMRYGGSGMSYLALGDWTAETTHRNYMLNNVLRDNGCYVPWAAVGKMSDGNGIIIDVNIQKEGKVRYRGRTLIANNLVIGSGGGGITVTSSSHVDIVNNTLYHNLQTKELNEKGWGDLFISGPPPNCTDVRVYNNVIWAAPGRAIVVAGRAEDYTFKNNVYFGDANAKIKKGDAGDANNVVADPKLVRPSMDARPEDFRPKAGSPAIGHASAEYVGFPAFDLAGALRGVDGPHVAGALLPAKD